MGDSQQQGDERQNDGAASHDRFDFLRTGGFYAGGGEKSARDAANADGGFQKRQVEIGAGARVPMLRHKNRNGNADQPGNDEIEQGDQNEAATNEIVLEDDAPSGLKIFAKRSLFWMERNF